MMATDAGMFGLWAPAAFGDIVDYDTWESELLEDEDIVRHIVGETNECSAHRLALGARVQEVELAAADPHRRWVPVLVGVRVQVTTLSRPMASHV